MKDPRTLKLPSGATAVIRGGLGRDLLNASRAAGANRDGVLHALIAELTAIDGRAITYEDVQEMPVADVAMLRAEVLG